LILSVFLIIAVIAGLYMAWNIGANDVANAMGTPVGSGALTLRKAVILAGIFEFLGAFFVGSNVAQTIGKGIVPLDAFRAQVVAVSTTHPAEDAPPVLREAPPSVPKRDPARERLAVGMLAALLAAAVWLNIATFFGQPVSTTHAIIGAVVGFAMVSVGPQWIRWAKMGKIVASWVISPVLGGFMAYVIYRSIRRFVLRNRHPVLMAKAVVPIALGAVVFILSLSILYKGLHLNLGAWSAVPLAAGAGVLVLIIARAIIQYRTRNNRYRVSERYQVVERWFSRIQILTACYMAFAHGANDVANAIGPLAMAVHGFAGSAPSESAAIPLWLLVLGGVGLVVGLGTYGYKVIEAVGKKITEITPTRGFSAEFATATTVLVCSKLGLPISTTLVLVGSVMGVGIARGFAAIDLRVIRRIFTSWVITIPVSAVFAAVFYWILMGLWGM
jgi:PiT family inorganic phosphate transporter